MSDEGYRHPANEHEVGWGYISRLKRLLRLKRTKFDEFNEAGIDLLDKMIAAVKTECEQAGTGDAANDILEQEEINFRLTHFKGKQD